MNWCVPKIWEDSDVWIIGGGPSLTQQFGIPKEEVDRVRAGESPSIYSPYMASIHGKHVIGINVAYLIGNWIDMVFFGDNNFYLKRREDLYKFPNLRVSCTPGTQNDPNIKYLAKDGRHSQGITPNPRFVSWNGNSGAAAISIAVNAGAKRVFLLGFDMKLDENFSQHWHLLYGQKDFVQPASRKGLPFNRHLMGFPAIAKDAKNRNVQIINVSPNSAIMEFSKYSLKDALQL